MERLYGSQTSIREVQGSVFSIKKRKKKHYLSQLGTEEELLQLSRQTIEILCGGQSSIGKAKGVEKQKNAAYLNQVQKKN